MDYKTLLVHLELGQANDGLLAIAGNLSDRFKTAVIGIAGCQPVQIMFDETYVAGEILAADREQIEKQMGEAERQFRSALGGKEHALEWRSNVTFGSLATYLAQQARAADLVITRPDIGGSMFDHTRQVAIANLVMEAGRPVLIVPNRIKELALGRIILAWKDTRECRRAAADALPLLKLAHDVTVVEIAPDAEIPRARHQVADVAEWLSRHGVKAKAEVVTSTGADSECLEELARERQADLIVAGAYGHSRLQEWILGGVTGDFLMNPDRCVLLSH